MPPRRSRHVNIGFTRFRRIGVVSVCCLRPIKTIDCVAVASFVPWPRTMERDRAAFWVVQVLTQDSAFGKQIALAARKSLFASKDTGFPRGAGQRGQQFWIEGSTPSSAMEREIKDNSPPKFKPELRHFRALVFTDALVPLRSAALPPSPGACRFSRARIGPANPSLAFRTTDKPTRRPRTTTTKP